LACSPDGGSLVLQGDLPLHPQTLVLARWQAMQQGFVQGVRLLKQMRHGISETTHEASGSSLPTPSIELTENLQTLLQDGGWSWTAQQGEALVSVPLHDRVHLVRLVQSEAHGTLQCRLEQPLRDTLSAMCRQAVGAFLLEGNTRIRLARLSLLPTGQGVVADVCLAPTWLDVVTLGQAMHAVAVAAHVIWPVLPALATEAVAQLYLYPSAPPELYGAGVCGPTPTRTCPER
jgi:hypothetical protein